MSIPIKIPLLVPVRVWGRLASIADRDGVTIPEVIADAIMRLIREDARTDVRRRVIDGRLGILDREVSAARRSGYRAPTRRGAKSA